LVLNIWYLEQNVLELKAENFVLILEGFPLQQTLKRCMMTVMAVVAAAAAAGLVVVVMSYP
jgi:hypothetical protein